MSLIAGVAAILAGVLTADAKKAADDAAEYAAIENLIDRTFAAIAADDPDMWRPLLTDEARNLSFRPDRNGPKGALSMRDESYKEVLADMTPGDPRLFYERWIGEPTVLVDGPVAIVWGRYDFWIDGVFSHCGVDTLNLAKIDGAWKIAHFMYTVELEGCATAGDAAPESARASPE
ncbi:MAG: nuclear transport factor 2 family protein [Pseudomonadota bacterium]